MSDRRKEIQDRIAKRRKLEGRRETVSWPQMEMEEQGPYGYESVSYDPGGPAPDHPLFRKEVFLFKVLAASFLFLAVAILFKQSSDEFDPAKKMVSKVMGQEFQFAAVSSWYEKTFGKPIAFLPDQEKKTGTVEKNGDEYAMPVLGKITESFEVNGEGIVIETGSQSKVEAVNGGIVTFAGTKQGLGKTVVVQHSDKSEAWYGELDSINVNVYAPVKKGENIGQVTASEDGSKGSFYLAIRKDDAFIDPNQVISFE